MDLVNSVTQNSNNKNVTMENRPPNEDEATATSYLADEPSRASMEQVKSQVPEYLRAIGMDPKKFWPKRYRFTREKTPGQYNPLTISQRNFYESNGYLVMDGCIAPKLTEAIRRERALDPSSSQLHLLLDKLVAKNGKLLQYVKCFCDERSMLMTHTLVDSFVSTNAHQVGPDSAQVQRKRLVRDWIYLPFRPIDKVVCVLTALEPLVNVVLVVPGTHRVGQCTTISSTQDAPAASYEDGVQKYGSGVSKELFECSPENLSSLVENSQRGFKYVDLEPGQTLFYHPGLVHGFSQDLVNIGRPQLASIAYYAAADCEYVEMIPRRQDITPGSETSSELPVGLAHFRNEHPSDYNSWINRPRLLHDSKASL